MNDLSKINSLRWILTSPVFAEDNQKTVTARRLMYAGWFGDGALTILVVLRLIVDRDMALFLLLTAPVYAVFSSVIVLVRLRRINAAVVVFLTGLWIAGTVAVVITGGTQAPTYTAYTVIIMWAVIFAGWRAALALGILTLCTGFVIAELTLAGTITSELRGTPMTAWLTQSLLMVLLLHGVYYTFTTIQNALIQAKNALAEREKAEETLRQNEERFRLISEVTSDYTFSSRLNDKEELEHIMLTGAFEAITGYPPDEFKAIGGWRATLYPDDVENDAHALEQVQQNQPVVHEVRIIKKGGEIRWVRVYASPIWDDDRKKLSGINGAVQDITERKRLELEVQGYTNQLESLVEERTAELSRTKDQLELILNHTSDAMAFTDSLGNIMVSNPAFRNAFEDHVSESIEQILWSLPDEDQMTTVSEALLEVIYNNVSQRVEAQIVSTGNGSTHKDIDLALIPVNIDESDTRNGVLLSGRDITQFKDIERFKERFVADAVHDLATPISGLSTRLHMLERDPEHLAEHARALGNQVLHLHNLLNDLRTLSQVDRGQIQLDLDMCDLNDLIKHVYDTYEPVAIDKGQRMILKLFDGLPARLLDKRRIERVLVNLVSNAVLYTPEGGAITIYSRQEKDQIIITVTDHGMGIGEADLPHIFERFYRSDEARQKQSTGTGLGLAICKEIVELHGGSIQAHSGIGEGSIFTIRLPVAG